MRILIVGGSGGIGLSLVKKCLDFYAYAELFATFHSHNVEFKHPRLKWQKLDVTNEKEIAQLATRFESLDIPINAVGFLHSENHQPEKSIDIFDIDFFSKNIQINTLPSILLAKYFKHSLTSNKHTVYVVLSVKIGSIKDNKIGGWLSYRTSKAALNMAIKTISIEWQRKLPNCCVLSFHPGTTDTELSKPFQRNLNKGQLHTSSFTSESILKLISTATPSDSGKFYSFNGEEIEW
ncbi:MAG: SDR family NAD(P)-dependent oxidoreductase [Shewanella sp.]|nr:SDR family NAD(P)-dependent oxidoreductase [Shewanella sp.]